MYKNCKGVQFSAKDTWDLDHSLSPVIHSALTKLREVILAEDFCKCPSDFFEETGDWDGDCDRGYVKWMEVLNEMIYAFGNNAPDIMAYNLEYFEEPEHGEETKEGYFQWAMSPVNPEAHERYTSDKAAHEKRKAKGLILFGTYYHTLWW